jgi:hypothetical protein
MPCVWLFPLPAASQKHQTTERNSYPEDFFGVEESAKQGTSRQTVETDSRRFLASLID